MAVDSGTWSVDWSLAVGIASLFATLAISLPQLLLQWREVGKKNLEEDPVLRAEWAARLRSGSAGAAYRDALARALAWLDRVFGPPGSLRALGICFLVAIAYAWFTFFLGWGFCGASGNIGGFSLLSNFDTQPGRAVFAEVALGLPPGMFIATRWLVRSLGSGDEWVNERLLRHLTPWLGNRGYRFAYWLMRTSLVGALVGIILIAAFIPIFSEPSGSEEASVLFATVVFFLLPYFGAGIAYRVNRYFGDSFASKTAGSVWSAQSLVFSL